MVGAPINQGSGFLQFIDVAKLLGRPPADRYLNFWHVIVVETGTSLGYFLNVHGHHGAASEGCTRIRTSYAQA